MEHSEPGNQCLTLNSIAVLENARTCRSGDVKRVKPGLLAARASRSDQLLPLLPLPLRGLLLPPMLLVLLMLLLPQPAGAVR
jgi:hypothetical protein